MGVHELRAKKGEGDGCVRSRPTEIVRQAHKQGKQGKGMNKTGEENKWKET